MTLLALVPILGGVHTPRPLPSSGLPGVLGWLRGGGPLCWPAWLGQATCEPRSPRLALPSEGARGRGHSAQERPRRAATGSRDVRGQWPGSPCWSGHGPHGLLPGSLEELGEGRGARSAEHPPHTLRWTAGLQPLLLLLLLFSRLSSPGARVLCPRHLLTHCVRGSSITCQKSLFFRYLQICATVSNFSSTKRPFQLLPN